MRLAAVLLSAAISATAFAQAPAPFYKKVSRVTWVVKDLDSAVRGWTKLGLNVLGERGETTLNVEYKGRMEADHVRWTMAALGNTYIDFMQPVGTTGPSAEFLAQRGEGIAALMYQVPDENALETETARMKTAGADVVQRGRQEVDGVEVRWVTFDTASKGAYTIGLIHIPADLEDPPPSSRDIKQFAFVIRDFEPVSQYWKKLGFPALSITSVDGSDQQYHGKPTRYDQQLGWQRHGAVPFEFCVPPKGVATVYQDYLEKRGEGLQHIAFNVDDMDKAITGYATLGFPNVQSGAWGQKGKPGSGRFAYIDTTPIGGVMIELLWNYR